MAFDPSIDKKLKEFENILNKLKADTAATATDLTKAAAQAAINALNNVLKSNKFGDIFNNAMSKAAQTSAKKFMQEFQKQTNTTITSLNKIASAISNIQSRTERVAERMARGFNEVHKSAQMVKKAVKDIDDQLAINTRMARRLGASLAHELKMNPLGSAKSARIMQELDELKRARAELKKVKNSAEQIPRSVQQLRVREKAADIMDRYLGPIDKARDAAHMGIELVKYAGVDKFFGMVAALGIVYELIKAIFGHVVASLKVSREAGLTFTQSMTMLRTSTDAAGQALRNGVLLSLEEATQYAVALGRQLGTIFVDSRLVGSAGTYGKLFNVGPEEMGRFTAMMYRMNGANVVETMRVVQNTGALAVRNGAFAADIFRTMVQHSEAFAHAGTRSADAFARAAINAQQLGVDMGKFSGLADTLVSDFEGGLRTQATLQTFFPGMSLNKVMYASQFGTDEQVQQAIVQAVRSTGQNFNTMPRSFKLALARSFGMSVEDIGNIMNGKKTENIPKMTLDTMEAVKTTLEDAITGRLGTIIDILSNIASVITLGGLIGKDANWSASVTTSPLNAPVGHGFARFHSGGYVSPRAFAGAPRYHFGLGPDEVPAILQTGEQVLSRSQIAAGGAGMSQVVALLQQILVATKEGHTIEMDGKKVGRALVDAHNR